MAIMPSQVEFYYSIGSTGVTAGQPDPDASLGGTISTTLAGGNVNNVWDDVPLAQAEAGRVEYRMLYVALDDDADGSLTGAVIWVDDGEENLDIALDTAAVGADSTRTIANETTAPSGMTFAGTAVSQATALTIGDLDPGDRKAFWLKRTTPAGAANAIKIPSVRVSGHTEA